MMKLIAALLLIPSLAFGDGRVRDADVATNAAIQPSKIAAGNWAGNAATATKLAASPTQCSAGQYASGIDQFANLTCSAVSGLPSQATHAGQYLGTDGTTASWSSVVSGINQLTGDVTAGAGSGSQAATVAFVGGSTASLVHTAELAANAATALNTNTTIVKRDGSGNFAAGVITASLTGNVTGNASTATAFDHTPTKCSAGNYPLGVDSGGNAASCTAAGGTAPVTTKGDLYGYDTAGNRIPVGTNGQLLTPNSGVALGLNWVTALPTAAVPAFTGDVTNSAGSLATTISASAVTNAKMANMANGTVKCRTTAGTGAPEDCSTLPPAAVPAFTGDVTTAGGALATTIAANAVTNAKAAQMAAHTIKGNNTGSTANSLDLTDAQVAAELPAFVGDSGSGGTKGSVPAPSTADFAKRKMLSAGGSFASQFSQVQNLVTLDTSGNSWALTKPDNFDAEASVGDWLAYADSPATIPVDMTGGSPNTTCARNTSSPIDGAADFLMTLTTGASRQGEGCSLLVNIPTAYRGKAIRLTFPYSTTGTIAAGDIIPYAYDVTNSTLLAPSNTISGITGSAGTHYSIFSTQNSTAQLRIGLHVARTSTAAATVEFDDVKLDPDVTQANVPVSDWAPCTGFTPNNFGTISSSSFFCRRVGDTREVSGKWISGTPAGASGSLTIPDVIDTSKMGTVASFQLGLGYNATGGPGQLYPGNATVIFYDGSDSGKVYFANGGTASTDVFIKTNASTFVNAGVGFSVKFSYPVSGWSSGGGTSPILSLSDWKSYSLTIGATTTPPTPGTNTNSAYWRRVGDSMEVTYWFYQTVSGSNGSGLFLFPLPSGYTIDTSKATVSSQTIGAGGTVVGHGMIANTVASNTATQGPAEVIPYDSTHLALYINNSNSGNSICPFGTVCYNFFNQTAATISFTARFPISGWTSTSSGTLTAPRTQAWLASINGFGSSNTAIARFSFINSQTGNITVTQSATLGDSITINEEGIYSVSENVSLGNTGVAGISVNSNQLTTNLATITTTNRLCAAQVSAADVTAACGTAIHLNVGDVLRVHAASSGNSNGSNGADSTFIVTKVSN